MSTESDCPSRAQTAPPPAPPEDPPLAAAQGVRGQIPGLGVADGPSTVAPASSWASDSDRPRGLAARCWAQAASGVDWLFGAAAILGGLAVLSSTPILQFLGLGYMLEVSGRVVRTGRLRDGFVGIRKASRVGALAAHSWVMLLPLRLIADMWYDAHLIDPLSDTALAWRRGLWIATGVIGLHLSTVWFCGGRARYFYWPVTWPWHLGLTLAGRRRWSDWLPLAKLALAFRAGAPGQRCLALWEQARDKVWEFVTGLKLPYYFSLGVRGFGGALAWLVVPGDAAHWRLVPAGAGVGLFRVGRRRLDGLRGAASAIPGGAVCRDGQAGGDVPGSASSAALSPRADLVLDRAGGHIGLCPAALPARDSSLDSGRAMAPESGLRAAAAARSPAHRLGDGHGGPPRGATHVPVHLGAPGSARRQPCCSMRLSSICRSFSPGMGRSTCWSSRPSCFHPPLFSSVHEPIREASAGRGRVAPWLGKKTSC